MDFDGPFEIVTFKKSILPILVPAYDQKQKLEKKNKSYSHIVTKKSEKLYYILKSCLKTKRDPDTLVNNSFFEEPFGTLF